MKECVKKILATVGQEDFSPEINDKNENDYQNLSANRSYKASIMLLLIEAAHSVVLEDRKGDARQIKNRGGFIQDVADIDSSKYERINFIDLPQVNMFERECKDGEISKIDFVRKFEHKLIWVVMP